MLKVFCGVSVFLNLCLHAPKDSRGETHTLVFKVSSTDFTLPCVTVSLEALLFAPYFDT